MKKFDKKYIILILTLVLVALEQLSKIIILNVKSNLPIELIKNILNISYVENRGAAFGISIGSVWGFIIINIIVIGILIGIIYSQKSILNGKTSIVYSLILAGGISNLIDRIFRGVVIDFIDITPIIDFPVFNFADIMIVVGVIIFGIKMIKGIIKKEEGRKS